MPDPTTRAPFDGIPSVGFAASADIACDPDTAWRVLCDYEAWNPTFVGASVTRVAGEPCAEGEIVRISKELPDTHGARSPAFHAQTVRIVPGRRLVWYVFGDEGTPFRNFVDFAVLPTPDGCRFEAGYYAQNDFATSERATFAGFLQATLDETASAFKEYCENQGPRGLHP